MYLPEKLMELTPLDKNEIIKHWKNQTDVVLKIKRWNKELKGLEVELEEFHGIIPVEEITIYPIQRKTMGVDIEILSLIEKKVVCRIINVDFVNKKVEFSRRIPMKEALNFLKTCSFIPKACVVNFYRDLIFFDIGYGIKGKVVIKDFTATRFDSIEDISCKKGDIFPLKVISINDERNVFRLSYREVTLSKDFKICALLSPGDILECKIGSKLNDESGNFFEFLPNASGIVDTKKYDFLLDETGDFAEINSIHPLKSGKKANILIKSLKKFETSYQMKGRFVSYSEE